MRPILFTAEIAGRFVRMRAYGFFLTLALVVGLAVFLVLAIRAGLPKGRVAALLAVSLVGALLGARLLNAGLNRQSYTGGLSQVFQPGFWGLSLYGGLLLASGLGVALARALRVPVWRFLDTAVPAVAGGLVFARIGCFLNGCCFGKPTDLPWGVSYPRGSPAWAYDLVHGRLNLFGRSSTVHPTQFYEMAGVLIALGLALWWAAGWPRPGWHRGRRTAWWSTGWREGTGRREGAGRREGTDRPSAAARNRPPGTTFLVFAGSFSLVRLGLYFLRAPVFATGAPAYFYPVFYTAIAVGCLGLVVARSLVGREAENKLLSTTSRLGPTRTRGMDAPASR